MLDAEDFIKEAKREWAMLNEPLFVYLREMSGKVSKPEMMYSEDLGTLELVWTDYWLPSMIRLSLDAQAEVQLLAFLPGLPKEGNPLPESRQYKGPAPSVEDVIVWIQEWDKLPKRGPVSSGTA